MSNKGRGFLLQLEQNPDGEQKEDGVSSQLGRYSDDEQRGRTRKTQKQYVLTVRAFKKCLTKSRNTQRYLDYFYCLNK